MGSTTPLHALPYPASGDAFNVPIDVENLANAVDNTLPYYGTTAPSSPAVGQLWWNSTTMQAHLWNGTAWIPAQAAPPAARVTITGSWSLANAAWTQITGGASTFTVDYDPYGLWSPSSNVFYLTSYPGIWRAHGRLSFPSNSTGIRGAGFAWSSSTVDTNRQTVSVASGNVENVIECNTSGQASGGNQYVRLMGFQNSGAAMTLNAVGEFSVEWLGPLA